MVSIFDHHLDIDPQQDLDLLLKQAPARWAVYLFADADGQPIQLLCVKNLRASLKRRLSGQELIGPTRKVNYREVARKVLWRRVDSSFEADLVYLEAARLLFPSTYRGMLGFELPWFVHVDPEQQFPRYVKTNHLDKQGLLLGPIEDKHAAARLVQLVEDAFDLCRYYNILTAAPNGRACAYKEMGKCPAPCDGSISMTQYHQIIELSVQALTDPQPYLRQQERRMKAAASDLHFEAAAKIKQYIDQLAQLSKPPFQHVRRLESFRFLSLQTGPNTGTVKLFLVTPGHVTEVAGLIHPPGSASTLLRNVLGQASAAIADTSETGAEVIGTVARHLFRPRRTGGIFIPLDQLDDKSLRNAYRELDRSAAFSQLPADDEGMQRELQQI